MPGFVRRVGRFTFLHNHKGSAYAYIFIVTMLLSTVIAVTLAVTAASRRVTAQYPYYAGLYDLAVAGNEQALRVLRTEIESQRSAIQARVYEQIAQTDMRSHLVYQNKTFYMAFPKNKYYAALYSRYANETAVQYLADTCTRTGVQYKTTSSVTVSLYEPDVQAMPGSPKTPFVTEVYQLTTLYTPHSGGFTVSTSVSKSTDGQDSFPCTVEAELIWPDLPHEEIFVPAYTWRDMPVYFNACLYASGAVYALDGGEAIPPDALISTPGVPLALASLVLSNAPPLTGITDTGLIETLSAYDAVWVTDADALDVSSLSAAGAAAGPMVVIHTGDTLALTASDAARSRFTGLLVSYGNLTLDGVTLHGMAMAGGDIVIAGPVTLVPDTRMPFKIPLAGGERENFYDFLRLSRFTGTGSGPVTDIASLLGCLDFDYTGENGTAFDLNINNFDADLPAMVELKKIAP